MPNTGLDALLRPEDSVLVLIDHQPYQLANLNSHDPQIAVNNAAALAKAAKAFGVPTILWSAPDRPSGTLDPAGETRTYPCISWCSAEQKSVQ